MPRAGTLGSLMGGLPPKRRTMPPPPELTPTGLGPTASGPAFQPMERPTGYHMGGGFASPQPVLPPQFAGYQLPHPGRDAYLARQGVPANTGFAGPGGGAGVPHAFPRLPPGSYGNDMYTSEGGGGLAGLPPGSVGAGQGRFGQPFYPFGQPPAPSMLPDGSNPWQGGIERYRRFRGGY